MHFELLSVLPVADSRGHARRHAARGERPRAPAANS